MNKYLHNLPVLCAAVLGVFAATLPSVLLAQSVYDGPGIVGGIDAAQQIGGIAEGDIRTVILNILLSVLLFMGLIAVVVIVIAGIWLVVSLGDEGAKDKAKKIILYAIVGLIVIMLSSAIVVFIVEATGGESIFGAVPNISGQDEAIDIRESVLTILQGFLNFMGLIAVIVIVIAGIYLVVSLGEEQAKDRAKRIIFYAVVGLLIILFASAIVGFITSLSVPDPVNPTP